MFICFPFHLILRHMYNFINVCICTSSRLSEGGMLRQQQLNKILVSILFFFHSSFTCFLCYCCDKHRCCTAFCISYEWKCSSVFVRLHKMCHFVRISKELQRSITWLYNKAYAPDKEVKMRWKENTENDRKTQQKFQTELYRQRREWRQLRPQRWRWWQCQSYLENVSNVFCFHFVLSKVNWRQCCCFFLSQLTWIALTIFQFTWDNSVYR